MSSMAAKVQEKLQKTFEATFLQVKDLSDGCGSKLDVIIVSTQFEGKSKTVSGFTFFARMHSFA